MWLSKENQSGATPKKGSGSSNSAANVDLRKLRRLDLLELLVDQIRENEENEKALEELTDLSERLKAKLDDKDVQIEHLKSRLSDKDVKIEHLKSRLSGKDVQIATLEKHLDIAPSSFVVFSPDVTVKSGSASAASEKHDGVDFSVAEPLGVSEPAVDEPLDAETLFEGGNLSSSEPDAVVQEAKQELPGAVDAEAAEQASDEAPAESPDSAQIIAEESERLAEAVQALKLAPEDFTVPAAAPLEKLKHVVAPSEQKASDSTGQEAKMPPVIEKPSVEKPPAAKKPSVGDLPIIEESEAEAPSAKKSAADSPSAGDEPADGVPFAEVKPAKKGKSANRKGFFGSLPFFGKKARKPSPAVDASKLDESSLPVIEAPAPSPAPSAGSSSASGPVPALSGDSLPTPSPSSSLDEQMTRPLPAVEKPKIDSLPTIKKPEIDDSSIPMV